MPRNGDGSSDNGPIEGQNIIHGNSGDTTLQHTQKVAPMPEIEKGDAIQGLGAGGVASQTATGEQIVDEEKKGTK